MNLKCTKCGSEKIIPLADMIDQGQNSDGKLKAVVGYTNPEAWVFKGTVYAKLKANICGQCGYTELIAEDPAAVYDAYLKLPHGSPATRRGNPDEAPPVVS